MLSTGPITCTVDKQKQTNKLSTFCLFVSKCLEFIVQINSSSQCKRVPTVLLIIMLPTGPDECSLMHSSHTSFNLYSSWGPHSPVVCINILPYRSPLIKKPCVQGRGPGSSLIIHPQSFIFSQSHGRTSNSSPTHTCVSSPSENLSARLCLLISFTRSAA